MKYLAFGLTLDTRINFDKVLQKSAAPADVFIEEGRVSEKAGRLTRLQRRGVRLKFGKTENAFILNWETIGKFKICGANRIVYENLGADEDTLKLFLLSEVIGVILYRRGIFLLHSSAVEIGGEALIFMGIGGAGKSTTATAFGKAGFNVLSDDMTAIKIIGSKPFVVPGFSQYKIWKSALRGLAIDYSTLAPAFEGADKFLIAQNLDKFPRTPLPLKKIYTLFPPASRIEEGAINPLRAPVELIKHFSLPIQFLIAEYLQIHFRQSLQIAEHAPIIYLKRFGNFELLEKFVRETAAKN